MTAPSTLRRDVLLELHERGARHRRWAMDCEFALISLRSGLVTPAEALSLVPDPDEFEPIGAIYRRLLSGADTARDGRTRGRRP